MTRTNALAFALALGGALLGALPGAPIAHAEDEKPTAEARPAPPTDAELKALAARIESRTKALEPNALGFDLDRALDHGFAGLEKEIPAAGLRDFRAGLRETLVFDSAINSAVRAGATYTYRRTKDGPRGKVLVFRLLQANGGMNFHELLPERAADGSLVIGDVFIYLSGEWFSATMRRQLLDYHESQNSGVIARLLGKDDADLAKSIGLQRKMAEAARAGRGREALALYAKLPASVQKRKLILFMRMQAAQALGDDDEYAAVLRAFETHHPDDPAWLLISVDAYVMRGDTARAIGSLEKLRKLVGADGQVDYLIASLWLGEGKIDQARRAAVRGIREEPKLDAVVFCLVDIELAAKDWPAVAKALTQCEKQLGVEFGDLTQTPGFEDFAKSAVHAKWVRARGK